MLEIVIVGFVVLAIAMPTLVTIMKLADARGDVASVATNAAGWYARHGQRLPEHDGSIELTYSREADQVTVVASTTVSVVSVFGRSVDIPVAHRSATIVSPFRSDHDR